ncbi:ATP-binding cassette sub-family G member 1 isoform X1 [Drosophila miranda]|uniref:ATP-binding cassette sub-family G member 1 isoform X1 n=3 Tax=pseudoobscura subgroup TaxID=32358 RepID=Q2LZ69_DROPS|nr:ATP-binding cassette sub-family G member 1 isoform X1 [Drosophila pseudoobscura]XP_017137397.1 ATP-binding cassette sub-family G member 1 isoform X1 [Drosophila miranda]XP_026847938.1 ATP-binding cassette sub-family G member 1 [Drosophila persimilis]
MDQARTLLARQSKDVEFQDVFYTVKERTNFLRVTRERQILNGVSGSFRNGQLSAIMGPSGAGKSSLLNAISGFRRDGVTGCIKMKRDNACYITQDDHHQTLLTVEELMNLSCDLKLKQRHRKAEVLTEILENLNLNHRRNVTAEKLSGGERKRLSIALELVDNPNIFFLDEPTSGLDEVTAAQCIRLLRGMAREGRTIVCTIHQPSATIYNCFDSIYVLAKGHCVYQGSPRATIPFLRLAQLDCPRNYSPSDYIIELVDAEDGHLVPALSELTENGKLIYVASQADIVNPHLESQQAVTTLFVEQPKRPLLPTIFAGSAVSTDGTLMNGASALLEQMKAFSRRMHNGRRDISGVRQFVVLIRIMMLRIMRARLALTIQLFHHLLCGLFFGMIFFQLGNQGARMFDHLKFCIGAVLMIVYTQVMVPILSYPAEVKVVKKETFNRWYTLTPYYMALTISRLPLQVLLNITFMMVTYWMSGLPDQIWRFGIFVAVGLMISLVAEGMGLAIGATFSITNGSVVGPMMIAPLMGLAVYGFDFAPQITGAMNLLMKFSYVRVGVVAMILAVFGFQREDLDCDDIYCHFSDPRVLLKFLDVEKVSLMHQFGILAMLMLFFRILMYISLRKRCYA